MNYLERVIPDDPASSGDLAAHLQRYRFAARLVSGKRVLDAGCGVGYGSRLLHRAGAIEVVGVDIAEDAIQIAEKQYAAAGVSFVRDNCESLTQVKGPFDVVVAFESIEHFQNSRKFLARVSDLLVPGGLFISSTPNGGSDGQKPANPHHFHEYGAQEFAALLQDYFEQVELLGQRWTAAFRAMSVLWSNPLIRLGRWAQNLRGHKLDNLGSGKLVPTEADLSITEDNLALAAFLLAVCGHPRKQNNGYKPK